MNDTENANELRNVGYQISKLLAKFLWPEINKNKNVKITQRKAGRDKRRERWSERARVD